MECDFPGSVAGCVGAGKVDILRKIIYFCKSTVALLRKVCYYDKKHTFLNLILIRSINFVFSISLMTDFQ